MKLGYANVDRMLRSISITQFYEWLTYAELEPFDEVRADYRAASIVQMIANMNRDSKRHPKPFPITEFVLKFGVGAPKKERQTWQQQKAIAKMMVDLYNAKD